MFAFPCTASTQKFLDKKPLCMLVIAFGQATAPECQLPVCCYLAALGGWRGSWVTPMRHVLPFGYVSEGGAEGKGKVMDFWAGSNNESVWQGECRRSRALSPSWGRFCRRQHQGLAAVIAAREGEGLVALPYASASCWRLRHSRSWKKKTTVLMAGSISAITPPVSSSPLSR
ncbi:hypothetical protein D3C84_847920 [compost metagenome]